MKRTKQGNYTYRIDNRTYIFKRIHRPLVMAVRVPSQRTASGFFTAEAYRDRFQVTYIAAGGGRIAKGGTREV